MPINNFSFSSLPSEILSSICIGCCELSAPPQAFLRDATTATPYLMLCTPQSLPLSVGDNLRSLESKYTDVCVSQDIDLIASGDQNTRPSHLSHRRSGHVGLSYTAPFGSPSEGLVTVYPCVGKGLSSKMQGRRSTEHHSYSGSSLSSGDPGASGVVLTPARASRLKPGGRKNGCAAEKGGDPRRWGWRWNGVIFPSSCRPQERL